MYLVYRRNGDGEKETGNALKGDVAGMKKEK